MKMLNRNQEQIRQVTVELRALAIAQWRTEAAQQRSEAALQRTEAALRGLIETRRGGNGHSKRKVDLQ